MDGLAPLDRGTEQGRSPGRLDLAGGEVIGVLVFTGVLPVARRTCGCKKNGRRRAKEVARPTPAGGGAACRRRCRTRSWYCLARSAGERGVCDGACEQENEARNRVEEGAHDTTSMAGHSSHGGRGKEAPGDPHLRRWGASNGRQSEAELEEALAVSGGDDLRRWQAPARRPWRRGCVALLCSAEARERPRGNGSGSEPGRGRGGVKALARAGRWRPSSGMVATRHARSAPAPRRGAASASTRGRWRGPGWWRREAEVGRRARVWAKEMGRGHVSAWARDAGPRIKFVAYKLNSNFY
jgi:hypothetical protein